MHPILWSFPEAWPLVGGFPIRSFSVMVLLGVLAGSWWIRRQLFNSGTKEDDASFDQLMRNSLIAGFLGARLTYVAIHPEVFDGKDLFDRTVTLIAVWQGGIVSYGGFFGGTVGMWMWCRAKKFSFAKLADVMGPALILGQAFGRIGCLLVGDDHGSLWVDGPEWLVVRFPDIANSLIPRELIGQPLHPSQIYLSLMNWVIFFVVAAIYRRRRYEGQTVAWAMALYAIGRFTVEFTRGDFAARGGFSLGDSANIEAQSFLSTAQLWSVITLGIALAAMVKLRQRTSAVEAAKA
ncbi:MAG: phosphatidylglycerol:prolipoprotein diacylglycerol transferase [Pseudohongiellaceae bacterium]|jgi:phosphatidylglycerol:prolipoprotein diacylglycerol transferase